MHTLTVKIAGMTYRMVRLLVLTGVIGQVHAQGFGDLVVPGPQPQPQAQPKTVKPHRKPPVKPVKPNPKPLEPFVIPDPQATSSQQGERLSARYRPLGPDGAIIQDRRTRLQWQRCSYGQRWTGAGCDGKAARLTWDEVLSLTDQSDWRVPTIEELNTLAYCSSGQPESRNTTGDVCKGNDERPTIDQAAFPNMEDFFFWSSSPYEGDSASAWYVSFCYGLDGNDYKGNDCQVRLVRGGQ